ncbi:innexin unc-9-like isoform X2 [Symsagittifera roscoffensis]|uniref:innexin unc-9-like isoform X2 n=2 Tax=Symsagittifera roscoffensis TaxID=84072 RepID=UPI00307BD8BF
MGLDDHYEKHLKYFPNPNHFKKDLELDLCSSGKAVTPHIQISPATVAAAASSPAGPSGAGFTSHPHPSGTENNPMEHLIMFPLRLVSGISQITGTGDGDFGDRLNHRYTPILLILFAILASTKQYVGEPINCWVPQSFSSAWTTYTNQMCWVSNTYYLPLNTPDVAHHPMKPNSYITYYQWVPIVLTIQAMFFYIPRKLWRMAGKRSGLDIDNIVVTATTFENAVSNEVREKTIQHIARHLDRYFGSQREYRRGCWPQCKQVFCFMCNRRQGTYLCIFYLFSKFLYIFNAIAQLFALNEFLGHRYHMYGIEALLDFINGVSWQTSHRFPRFTLCDFSVRVMGVHIHDYTVQCVLSINLFNEMIYFFIWWWTVIVICLTIVNFSDWAFKLVFTVDRIAYVKKHLKFMDRYDKTEHRKLINTFVYHYLKNDGVFLIRLLAKNTNTLMTSEIVAQLWDNYRERHRDNRRLDYSKTPTGQRLNNDSNGMLSQGNNARRRNNNMPPLNDTVPRGSNQHMYPLTSMGWSPPPPPLTGQPGEPYFGMLDDSCWQDEKFKAEMNSNMLHSHLPPPSAPHQQGGQQLPPPPISHQLGLPNISGTTGDDMGC